jgi:Protein of unknown function (DUF2934)
MAKKTSASPPTVRKRTAPGKKPNGASHEPETASGSPSDEEIRLRAYHRYLDRGAGHGSDLDDWVEAEKDLKATRS